MPFSPVISTRPELGAVLATLSKIARIAAPLPIIAKSDRARVRSRAFSSRSRANDSAFCTVIRSLSPDSGFSMKSCAPALVAVTAVSIVALPDIITTMVSGLAVRIFGSTSRPLSPGIITSSRTRSMSLSASLARPPAPLPATSTA